jgi:hypothetical protein
MPPGDSKPQRHPIGTPRGLSAKGGMLAVGAWLAERGIFTPEGKPWRIEIALGTAAYRLSRVFAESIDTRFQITILPDEWSYYFAHGGRVSRVRVSDAAEPDGRDDHSLASATPTLRNIGVLVRHLEQRFNIFLQRPHALIETTLLGAEPIVRAWLTTL